MACPHEDHDIDVLTDGRCRYCQSDVYQREPILTVPVSSVVYSPTQACDMCGEVHPT